ncbi:hypothetical protein D9M68_787190 [compost metagenome]
MHLETEHLAMTQGRQKTLGPLENKGIAHRLSPTTMAQRARMIAPHRGTAHCRSGAMEHSRAIRRELRRTSCARMGHVWGDSATLNVHKEY